MAKARKVTEYLHPDRGELRSLREGDVVEAEAVFVDHDEHGTPYIHAVPGTLGVVESTETPGWPNVNWGPTGHGTCNVDEALIRIYQGTVFYVTGPVPGEEKP